MRANNIVLIALICVIVLAMVGYEYDSYRKDARYREEIAAEQDKILLELEKLNKEIEALETDLSGLKVVSKDYNKKMEEAMGKQTQLQAPKEFSLADPKQPRIAPKVAVISIRKIFQGCKRNIKYREEAVAEQNRVIGELEKLSDEIEAEKAGLRTLKPGSSDQLSLMREVLEKQASLQARQEFHKQQMALKDQRWTEELYKGILQEASKVAEQKGLDLVLERSEIELPALSANELMLTIRTHKLLYSGGCLDITDEVLARLDAEEGEKQEAKSAEP